MEKQPADRRLSAEAVTSAPPYQSTHIDEKRRASIEKTPVAAEPNEFSDKDEIASVDDGQAGVKKMEAATAAWSKGHLITAYALIWFIYFISSLQEVVIRAFTPFVTSSFSRHSLSSTVYVFSSIIAGMTKISLAKILDIWGRPQGMAMMMVVWTLGFVMMAACKNVETFAAAQVFSTVGAQGTSYCMTVFVADTSGLRNRGLMLAFATSPYIITTYVGGPMGEAFIKTGGPGWRWGFGVFCILTPIVVFPLVLLFFWAQYNAQKKGLIQPKANDGPKTPWLQSAKKFAIDFDLLGVFMLTAGMTLFLLPFNIWSYQEKQWRSPMIICFLVFGFLLIVAFALYERLLAPVTFVPTALLKADRTIIAANLMLFFVFFNSAVWGNYFVSMLLVAFNQSVSNATYISNIYRPVSCFSALVIGYLIRVTGRYKWVALYFAVPLMILGVGLMIEFRQPDAKIGYIVMTQIFVAVAGGPIVVAAEIAMMAPLDHQHMASIIAILDLAGSIGYAVGSSVCAAIWTGTFEKALEKYLPKSAPIKMIYNNMYSQLGYPVGSPTRIGISWAYADSQRYMLITSCCALAGAFICVLFWKDRSVKEKKQVKGVVV